MFDWLVYIMALLLVLDIKSGDSVTGTRTVILIHSFKIQKNKVLISISVLAVANSGCRFDLGLAQLTRRCQAIALPRHLHHHVL